jgi:valyl-tRNA synthetase
MDHLASTQELEAQQKQHAALFYQMHHQEAAERLKRQALREELARILVAMREAQAATNVWPSNNVQAALSVRASMLNHQIVASSAQIASLAEQEELAERCYEETLRQLEAFLAPWPSDGGHQD